MNAVANPRGVHLKRVLLIEDDAATRAMYRAYLEDAHYIVMEADNGELGAKMVTDFQPGIVITDIFLPDKDGLQVILETKSANDEVKFIAISGGTGRVGGNDYLEIARLFGATKTLLKPFDKQTLITACQELSWAAATT